MSMFTSHTKFVVNPIKKMTSIQYPEVLSYDDMGKFCFFTLLRTPLEKAAIYSFAISVSISTKNGKSMENR